MIKYHTTPQQNATVRPSFLNTFTHAMTYYLCLCLLQHSLWSCQVSVWRFMICFYEFEIYLLH